MWFHFLVWNKHYPYALDKFRPEYVNTILVYSGTSLPNWYNILRRTESDYVSWLIAYLEINELKKFKKQLYLILEWIVFRKSNNWLKLTRLLLADIEHIFSLPRFVKQTDLEMEDLDMSLVYHVYYLLFFFDMWKHYDTALCYPIYARYSHFFVWLHLVKYNLDFCIIFLKIIKM
jgi:hypothetical protein